jgi:hypothetical protein
MTGYYKLLRLCGGSLCTEPAIRLETAYYCYLLLPFQPGAQCYPPHYRHVLCAVLVYGPMRFKHVMSMPVLTNGKETTEPIDVCIGLRWYGLTETTRTACRSMGINHLEHNSLSLHWRTWIHQTRYAILSTYKCSLRLALRKSLCLRRYCRDSVSDLWQG